MGKTKKHEKKSKSSKKHKHKDHKVKKKSKKSKKEPKPSKEKKVTKVANNEVKDAESEQIIPDNFAIPVELMNSKSHAPETPEEYQRRQSQIRRETDPVTGRIRLIKGDGEVLEEIVSRERHVDINKGATQGDGRYFQDKTLGKHKRK